MRDKEIGKLGQYFVLNDNFGNRKGTLSSASKRGIGLVEYKKSAQNDN